MSTRLDLLRALAAMAAPARADAATLQAAVLARQQLFDQLQTCDQGLLSQDETDALDAARLGQAAWEQRCTNLLHDVQARQDAARGRARHEDAATGRLVNRHG